MNALAQAAGATSDLVVGNERFTMSPLTIGDLANFAQWAEDQAIAKAERRNEVRKRYGATAADLRGEVEKVFTQSDNGTLEARAMASFQGITRLCWLSIRRAHPDITEDKVADLVTAEGMKAMQTKIDRLSGMNDDPEDDDPNDERPATNAGQAGEKSSDS